VHQPSVKEESKQLPSQLIDDSSFELKGNKQLEVEVKLSDLIRYGALG
jgi:hypothetical protein